MIIKPGFHTSVQDRGRYGYRKYGVPVSGAMDLHHASLANMLVGNTGDNPVLEVTLSGPEVQFFDPTYLAISGADISPSIDGKLIEMNKKIWIEAGQILSFGKVHYGVRAYIGIRGLHTEKVLQSNSQYKGITPKHQIDAGEWFSYQKITGVNSIANARLKEDMSFFENENLSVSPGPEFDIIGNTKMKELLAQPFEIKENNRMGYNLSSDIDLKNSKAIITSNVVPGTIQLTPSGRLIVLMRDGQVTGGYPRIFQLSEQSINQLAQKQTGSKIFLRLKPNI